MRVRLLTGRATQTGSHQYGDVITVPDNEGRRLIADGNAERATVGPGRPRNETVAGTVETAAMRTTPPIGRV